MSSNCMSCNKTFNHLSVWGRTWILTKSLRMEHLHYLIGMVKVTTKKAQNNNRKW